jgi:Helicase HerA, central domain
LTRAGSRELEEIVVARASSIDGRRFTFRAPVDGLELQIGGYASVDGHLAQIHSLELASGNASSALGEGVMLEEEVGPFGDLPVERASTQEVEHWLAAVRPERAALEVGELVVEPSARFLLDAGGFDRHTFFCGQSGSGKTYSLGTVIEQLLLQTSIRIVVLDPNSDFVRLNVTHEGLDEGIAHRYREAAAGIAVRRAGPNGADRLHVRFTDCDAEEQGAVLRLDPIHDLGQYGALVDLLEGGFEEATDDAAELAQRMLASSDPNVQGLGARVRNLGIHRWQVWSTGDADSVQDLVAPGGPRGLVVDLGSLETTGEKAIAAESVLAALWRRREAREPTLVVIDEAHNVCPREPADPVTALATEHAARFAAEGRKFGLYLLVSTQRPQRVNELVVSQCDNLVLMRMASAADLAYVAAGLSYAPLPLLERATSFGLGEALVAGKITSHPAFVRFGPRIAQEGGGDVPTTWAEGGPS